MHAVFWVALIASLGCSAFALSELEQWKEYKKIHEKSYPDPAKDAYHFAIYQKAVKRVNEHNAKFKAGKVTYSKRLSEFSDLSEEQFPYQAKLKLPDNFIEHQFLQPIARQDIPDAIDWREKGYVTPVKWQGCGDCYLFAAIGALEGFNRRVNGKLVALSEQNIRECYRDRAHICGGGDPTSVIHFVAHNQSSLIDPEILYPFNSNIGDCKYNKTAAINTTVKNYNYVAGEDKLKTAVGTRGPVVTLIHATKAFQEVHKEVFYDPTCPKNITLNMLNHAVLAVGYGTDPKGGDYWIIKNSWKATWGDEGYVKMARNRDGHCGIGQWNIYPV